MFVESLQLVILSPSGFPPRLDEAGPNVVTAVWVRSRRHARPVDVLVAQLLQLNSRVRALQDFFRDVPHSYEIPDLVLNRREGEGTVLKVNVATDQRARDWRKEPAGPHPRKVEELLGNSILRLPLTLRSKLKLDKLN